VGVGKFAILAVAVAFCVGCGQTHAGKPPDDGGNPNIGPDAGADAGPADSGTPDAGPPDAGHDAGTPPDAGFDAGTPPDAGSDAGTPPDAGSDAGTPPDGGTDGGPKFGGPGPWPLTNQIYGTADGIQEQPVVGVTTDETQNLWVATNAALYVMKPGDTRFRRFDASSGTAVVGPIEHRLHLPGNDATECYDSAGTFRPCPYGSADQPGISEIVGGGSNEVFVGYYGHHNYNDPNDGTEQDPYRHSGKLDRVRLQLDGSLEVIRFDMVSNNTVMYWHNRTVERMVYDHFKHPHELYVGTDHGVDKISPDKWKPNDPPPNSWFLLPQNQQSWMSDHLHPQACYHHTCSTTTDDPDLRLGDWRGLALDSSGDLWVAGRWAAGAIVYTADNTNWYNNPRDPVTKASAYKAAFGDSYTYCDGNRPIFCVPREGDFVNLSAVAVTKDPQTGLDVVWFSSGVVYNDIGDINYGVAAWRAKPGPGQQQFTYFDPVRDIGMAESTVRDMLALPDGRLVFVGPTTGLTIWDPVKGTHVSIRSGQGIPDDHVLGMELDNMVNPPALHVSTWGGAAVLRKLP
jgi:hypothetical protein